MATHLLETGPETSVEVALVRNEATNEERNMEKPPPSSKDWEQLAIPGADVPVKEPEKRPRRKPMPKCKCSKPGKIRRVIPDAFGQPTHKCWFCQDKATKKRFSA